MPTVFRSHGYSFYFFSHEPGEPPHVHIDRGDGGAKVWLENVAIARDSGFKAKELSQILTLVRENRTMLLEKWHGYFGNSR
jgi:Domain of unknown function (DUF4160)